MREFFSCWNQARRDLTPPDRVLWLFDFDGTLAPIEKHPSRAEMPRPTRLLLGQLLRRFPGHVGVLSGRALKHLRPKVAMRGLIYGGTHGFEIEGPDFKWHYPLSQFRKRRLQAWIRRWRRKIKAIPGLWIENKGWTACLHFREVRPSDRRRLRIFLQNMCRQTQEFGFQLQKGLQSLEFYSDARWNKGHAALWLKKRSKAFTVFYVGDDTTDESVFSMTGRSDVSVRVKSSGASKAKYFIKRQSETNRLLKRILTL